MTDGTDATDLLVAGGDRWNGETADAWRVRWGVPALRIYRRVGSTNDVAREMAEAGAEQGATVVTDEQTRGRGRRGRTWHSRAGSSVLLSMVLRPRRTSHEALLPLRLGVAAARAIESVTGLAIGLKWPNDLFIRGRKVGGLLCEGAVEGDRPLFLIAGVGINVFQSDDEFPGELAGYATSLALESHRSPPPVHALAGRVIAELIAAAGAGARPLSDGELADIGARDVLRGRAIEVDGSHAGVASGIAPDGALIIDNGGGARRLVSGTVRAIEDSREPAV